MSKGAKQGGKGSKTEKKPAKAAMAPKAEGGGSVKRGGKAAAARPKKLTNTQRLVNLLGERLKRETDYFEEEPPPPPGWTLVSLKEVGMGGDVELEDGVDIEQVGELAAEAGEALHANTVMVERQIDGEVVTVVGSTELMLLVDGEYDPPSFKSDLPPLTEREREELEEEERFLWSLNSEGPNHGGTVLVCLSKRTQQQPLFLQCLVAGGGGGFHIQRVLVGVGNSGAHGDMWPNSNMVALYTLYMAHRHEALPGGGGGGGGRPGDPTDFTDEALEGEEGYRSAFGDSSARSPPVEMLDKQLLQALDDLLLTRGVDSGLGDYLVGALQARRSEGHAAFYERAAGLLSAS